VCSSDLASQPVPAEALTALARFGAKPLVASLGPDIEGGIVRVLHDAGGFDTDSRDAKVDGHGSPTSRFPRALPRSRTSLDG